MQVMERPVLQIENSTKMREILLAVVPLMKSLKNTFEISNFYKEARTVSFMDRLL
jgi:hypothetical protein